MARPRVISSVLIGLMFAVLVVASATDMLYRKVFNWLTVPAALVAIALNATQGWPGFKQSGTGLLIGLAIVGRRLADQSVTRQSSVPPPNDPQRSVADGPAAPGPPQRLAADSGQ